MCGNKIGNPIQGNSLETSKPVTGRTSGSFRGMDVTVVSTEKSSLTRTLSLDMIDQELPSTIDFRELDIQVLSRYNAPEDQRPALAALHVSKYSERLSNLEDKLLQDNPGVYDLRAMLTELETLELQAFEDHRLGGDSNDRLAITGYLDEVKKLLNSCLETREAMAGIREDLTGEKPDYTSLQNRLQGIGLAIEQDTALELEKGRYRAPLHNQRTGLDRVISFCSGFADSLAAVRERLTDSPLPGVEDLRSMIGELHTLEQKALKDIPRLDGSNDRLAITGDFDKVKKLLTSCLETSEAMAGIREELTGENPDYTSLQKRLQDIGREIKNDTALELEQGRYRVPLHNHQTGLGRVVSSCSGFADSLAAVRSELAATLPDFKALSLGLQELTQAIAGDQELGLDNGVYRAPLLQLASEIGQALAKTKLKAVLHLVEQHIPVLKKSIKENSLSQECLDAFVKLHEHGFLNNPAFLQRLNLFVTGSHRESVFTEKDIEGALELANRNFPGLAQGNPHTIDMLLKGPQWDTFSLKMKLSLDPEVDREKVEVRHLCTIAKRELARNVQLVTGRFKRNQDMESDFHDIRFDDNFIEGLLANPNLKYQKIDLMLANVLILEARIDNRLNPEDRQSVKIFSEKLKKLGFNDSLENIQRHIAQDFKSSAQVKKAARAVEKFARSLGQNKMAFNLFAQACQQAPQVRAGRMLDILSRNFSEVQTENFVKFTDIKQLVVQKNIMRFRAVGTTPRGVKQLKRGKKNIQELNRNLSLSRMESGRAKLELNLVLEKKRKCLVTLLGVEQNNFENDKVITSSQQLLSVFADFQALDIDNPDSKLLTKIKETLNDLKKFDVELMRIKRRRGKGEANAAFKKHLTLLNRKSNGRRQDFSSIIRIMNLFTENKIQEKAQAIVDLGGTDQAEGLLDQEKRLEQTISREQGNQKKMLKKVHGLLPKDHTRLIRHTLQAVVLNAFVGSGKKNWSDFTLDREEITSIMVDQLGVPEYTFSGELSVISDSMSEDTLLQVWEEEIKLDSSLVRESKKVHKKAPKEHLEIIRSNEWEKMLTTRMDSMETGQDFSLGFGRSLTVSSGEIPVGGPLDLEVSLTMAQDNSLTVSRTETGFEVMIKGGKSVGSKVNLSSFLKSVEVGVKGELGRAKGCQLTFTDKKACQRFLGGLMSGKAPVSSWIKADKVLMVRETSLGAGVTATVTLPDQLPNQVSNVLGQQGIGVNIGLEGEISGQVQWTTRASASRIIRTTETSFSLSMTGSIEVSNELLNREKSVSLSGQITVNKSSEMVYQYGVISSDSGITRSFRAGKQPLHTLLYLLKKNALTFPEDDPRRSAVIELAGQAGRNDHFEIIWKLEPDIALQIAELQFVGKHQEADALLRKVDSFQPFQVVLVSEDSISQEQIRSFKSIEVTDFAESGTTNRLVIDLAVERLERH